MPTQPFGSRQGRGQFFGVQPLDVARCTGLDAPAFSQRTGVNHVETEAVDQLGQRRFATGSSPAIASALLLGVPSGLPSVVIWRA